MTGKFVRILQMIRFSHTIFALPFAMLAAVMAWSIETQSGQSVMFRWLDLAGILICMVAARSAAMAFNRLVDRNIDAANPRTSNRHLPAGTLSVPGVAMFTVVCSVLFVLGTFCFFPNRLPLYLSGPVLAILFLYSLTKRFTSLAHYWLGLSLMLAPIAVWIALRGDLVATNPADLVPASMLGLAVFVWVAGFDIIYACQDFEFDKSAKLKSVPARFGISGALKIAAASHLAMVLVLVALPAVSLAVGTPTNFGFIYYAAIAAIAVLLAYQHRLVNPDDLTRVNIAFFNVNSVISFGLFLAGGLDSLI